MIFSNIYSMEDLKNQVLFKATNEQAFKEDLVKNLKVSTNLQYPYDAFIKEYFYDEYKHALKNRDIKADFIKKERDEYVRRDSGMYRTQETTERNITYNALFKLQQNYSESDSEINKQFVKEKYAKNEEDMGEFFNEKREFLEKKLNIEPLKEFGTNYAEFYHDGVNAIKKLLAEAEEAKKQGKEAEYKGQVAGAFYKDGLGDIDLVWGEVTNKEAHKGYGLAHILDKRTSEFSKQGLDATQAQKEAREFIEKEIPQIIEKGEIIANPNEAIKIETDKYKLILKGNWRGEPTTNKWVVTAYYKQGEKGESISSTPFIKEDNLSLNSNANVTTQEIKTQETQTQSIKTAEKIKDEITFLQESIEILKGFNKDIEKEIETTKQKLAEVTPKLRGMTFSNEQSNLIKKRAYHKKLSEVRELEKQLNEKINALKTNEKTIRGKDARILDLKQELRGMETNVDITPPNLATQELKDTPKQETQTQSNEAIPTPNLTKEQYTLLENEIKEKYQEAVDRRLKVINRLEQLSKKKNKKAVEKEEFEELQETLKAKSATAILKERDDALESLKKENGGYDGSVYEKIEKLKEKEKAQAKQPTQEQTRTPLTKPLLSESERVQVETLIKDSTKKALQVSKEILSNTSFNLLKATNPKEILEVFSNYAKTHNFKPLTQEFKKVEGLSKEELELMRVLSLTRKEEALSESEIATLGEFLAKNAAKFSKDDYLDTYQSIKPSDVLYKLAYDTQERIKAELQKDYTPTLEKYGVNYDFNTQGINSLGEVLVEILSKKDLSLEDSVFLNAISKLNNTLLDNLTKSTKNNPFSELKEVLKTTKENALRANLNTLEKKVGYLSSEEYEKSLNDAYYLPLYIEDLKKAFLKWADGYGGGNMANFNAKDLLEHINKPLKLQRLEKQTGLKELEASGEDLIKQEILREELKDEQEAFISKQAQDATPLNTQEIKEIENSEALKNTFTDTILLNDSLSLAKKTQYLKANFDIVEGLVALYKRDNNFVSQAPLIDSDKQLLKLPKETLDGYFKELENKIHKKESLTQKEKDSILESLTLIKNHLEEIIGRQLYGINKTYAKKIVDFAKWNAVEYEDSFKYALLNKDKTTLHKDISESMDNFLWDNDFYPFREKYLDKKEVYSNIEPLKKYFILSDGVDRDYFNFIHKDSATLKNTALENLNLKTLKELYIDNVREKIQEKLNIEPLAEFGTNYAEFYHDGKRAIKKLLLEAEEAKKQGKEAEYKGQVAGAFYKDGLGDIDLVWGEVTNKEAHKGYGLAHILDKHPHLDVYEIPKIIEEGDIVDLGNGKIRIVTPEYTIGMKKEWHDKPTNHFILTAFENTKESAKNLHSSTFTKGETLPLNSNANTTTNELKTQENAPTQPANEIKQAEGSTQDSPQPSTLQNTPQKPQEPSQEAKEAKDKASNYVFNETATEVKEPPINENIKNAPILKNSDLLDDLSNIDVPLTYRIVKKADIKPSFESGSIYQFRSKKQYGVIASVKDNFNPKLIFGKEGSYDGVPLIDLSGYVMIGNHRSEAINQLSGENLQKYKEAVKNAFKIELKDDEVVVGVIDPSISYEKRQEIAKASNLNRLNGVGEQILALSAKLDSKLKDFPKIEASSLDDQLMQVRGYLGTSNDEDANLALLGKLDKESRAGIVRALDYALEKNDNNKAFKDMIVLNANTFKNLVEIGKEPDGFKYLSGALLRLATKRNSRAEDLGEFIEHFKAFRDMGFRDIEAEAGGGNILRDFYLFKADLLGVAIRGFMDRTNPTEALFERLSEVTNLLKEQGGENLFTAMDRSVLINFYDFLEPLIYGGDLKNAKKVNEKLRGEVVELIKVFKQKEDEIQQGIKNGSIKAIQKDFLEEIEAKIAQTQEIETTKETLTAPNGEILASREQIVDAAHNNEVLKEVEVANITKDLSRVTTKEENGKKIEYVSKEAKALEEAKDKRDDELKAIQDGYLKNRMDREEFENRVADTLEQWHKDNLEAKEAHKELKTQEKGNSEATQESKQGGEAKEAETQENETITLKTNGVKNYTQLNKEFKEAITPILNKDIRNKETGIVARISSDESRKMISKKAVDKSLNNGFTKEEHFLTSENIKKLFESAVLLEKHADTKNRESIVGVLRFRKDLKINSKPATAKITVFEKNVGGNKIYSIELESLENPHP